MNQLRPPRQPCRQCVKLHLGVCQYGTNACFWCGMSGHMMSEYPQKGIEGMTKPTGSAISSSSSVPYSGRGVQPMGRGRGAKGAASSSGVQNHTYALANRQNSEASPDVVTGTLSIFSYDVYALVDPGSTLSYVTPLVAEKFKKISELLVNPLEVSMPIDESVIARECIKIV